MSAQPTKYEQLLRTVERQLHVALTVHDELGLLRDSHGMLLLPSRNLHPHPYCVWGRHASQAIDRKCCQHCVIEVSRRLRAAPSSPLETCCWKGVRELVIPVTYHGLHALTVFVGSFRQPEDICPLSGGFKDSYPSLPVDNYVRLHQLADLIRTIFIGVLRQIEEERVQEDRQISSRRQLIEQFIHQNASRNGLAVADLSKKLCLSSSRTAHLVLEECGQSFHSLLTRERLHRAKTLLLTENLTIAEIAEHTGFGTASYFCRIFRQHYGLSPAQFRVNK